MKNSKIYTFLFGFLLFIIISIFFLYKNSNKNIKLYNIDLKKSEELTLYKNVPKTKILKKKSTPIIIQKQPIVLQNKKIR